MKGLIRGFVVRTTASLFVSFALYPWQSRLALARAPTTALSKRFHCPDYSMEAVTVTLAARSTF